MKHHYIPAFYLRAWTSQHSGELVEFSRHNGVVKPLRRSPDGAGYKRDLYNILGAPIAARDIFETDFLKIIDDRGSRVARKMIAGETDLSEREMIWWAHFLLSIMARSPASVATLNQVLGDHLTANRHKVEQEVARLVAEDPDYIPLPLDETMPAAVCRAALSLVKTFTLQQEVCNLIVGKMHWSCLHFNESYSPLLTSDRPVLKTNGLDKQDGQLIIPLSPRVAFFAVRSERQADAIRRMDLDSIRRQVNDWVVRQAVDHVYAIDKTALRFVQKQMGTAPKYPYVDYRKQSWAAMNGAGQHPAEQKTL